MRGSELAVDSDNVMVDSDKSLERKLEKNWWVFKFIINSRSQPVKDYYLGALLLVLVICPISLVGFLWFIAVINCFSWELEKKLFNLRLLHKLIAGNLLKLSIFF